MNKEKVVKLVGNGNQRECARRLGYKNPEQVYHWSKEFTSRQKGVIIFRMRACGIAYPKSWEKGLY